MSLLEERLVELDCQTSPISNLDPTAVPTANDDLESLNLRWADETLPRTYDYSYAKTTTVVGELDKIDTKWGTETIWLPPLAGTQVEVTPVVNDPENFTEPPKATWLPPEANTRIEFMPLGLAPVVETDTQDGLSIASKASDDVTVHESIRETITRLRKELEDAKLAAELETEAKKLSLIAEFSLNNAEYPGPKLTASITDVARSMYGPENPKAPEQADGTGFTRQELFDWLAEREVADAKAQTDALAKIVLRQRAEHHTRHAVEAVAIAQPVPEQIADEITENIESVTVVAVSDECSQEDIDTVEQVENVAVIKEEQAADSADAPKPDEDKAEPLGYKLSFEQFTVKHIYPFGKRIAARNEAYESTHWRSKPNRIWQKLAKMAPKNEEEVAEFVFRAAARTETVNSMLKNDQAHIGDSIRLSTRPLFIDRASGLAELAKTDPTAVKTLARGMAATVQLSSGPEDIRHLTVYLSNEVKEELPKITRKIMQHFPRLGAKLLRNTPAK